MMKRLWERFLEWAFGHVVIEPSGRRFRRPMYRWRFMNWLRFLRRAGIGPWRRIYRLENKVEFLEWDCRRIGSKYSQEKLEHVKLKAEFGRLDSEEQCLWENYYQPILARRGG